MLKARPGNKLGRPRPQDRIDITVVTDMSSCWWTTGQGYPSSHGLIDGPESSNFIDVFVTKKFFVLCNMCWGLGTVFCFEHLSVSFMLAWICSFPVCFVSFMLITWICFVFHVCFEHLSVSIMLRRVIIKRGSTLIGFTCIAWTAPICDFLAFRAVIISTTRG